jgi:hypothetical protein
MKTLIKKLLNEALLSEKLANVDDDVNFLYDKYFKADIDEIERTGVITNNMFKRAQTNTSELRSEDSVKANELSPCIIKVNFGKNYYKPIDNEIGISVSSPALNFVMSFGQGNIEKTLEALTDKNQRKSFIKEFVEERIKGSIHHELAHWIDDTMHNKHLLARIKKSIKHKTIDLNNIPVNSTRMEIEGQIHNIKQLHNKYKDIWDTLSFQDMIDMSPSITHVNSTLLGDIKIKWRKEIRQRMNREGLLGKKMTS